MYFSVYFSCVVLHICSFSLFIYYFSCVIPIHILYKCICCIMLVELFFSPPFFFCSCFLSFFLSFFLNHVIEDLCLRGRALFAVLCHPYVANHHFRDSFTSHRLSFSPVVSSVIIGSVTEDLCLRRCPLCSES